MKRLITGLLLLSAVFNSTAQVTDEQKNRLTVFENAVKGCRAVIITSPALAKNLVVATSRSLTDVCECAALLALSDLSDDEVGLIANRNKEASDRLVQPLFNRSAQCVKMH